MAPRGRKRKAGMMREDAARDAMRDLGFDENVIKESLKEIFQVYGDDHGRFGDDHWRMLEGDRYESLLNICLEKQRQREAIAEEQEEEAQEEETHGEEQEQGIEEVRDHVGSSLTSIVTEPTRQVDPDDADSNTIEDLVPSGFAQQSVEGALSSRCGWYSSEEETEHQEEDGDGDDDEMIQLTPEPLCEELEELVRKVRGQKKEKRATRWDK